MWSQIVHYYEEVLRTLVATGRVTWLPHTEYGGVTKGSQGGPCQVTTVYLSSTGTTATLTSLLQDGLKTTVRIKRKLVDCTAMETRVPSTQPPNYKVEEGVSFIPINGLTKVERPWKCYTVVGAGKTGLDALLYLLDQGVRSESLRWIVSNDCWYLNRDAIPREGGFAGPKACQAVMEANNLKEIYKNYEQVGLFMRVDNKVEPSKMRAATVSESEMEKIRTIKNVIRKGRIERISGDKIIFMNGEELSADPATLYVDCSASGTMFTRPLEPIFQDSKLVLQMVQLPAPTNSGAIIAGLELISNDNAWKNNVVEPHGAPHELEDWFLDFSVALRNFAKIKESLGFWWMWNRRLCAVNLTEVVGRGMATFIGGNCFFSCSSS